MANAGNPTPAFDPLSRKPDDAERPLRRVDSTGQRNTFWV